MIYQCNNCGKYFTEDEIDYKDVDLENLYGVGGEFDRHTKGTVALCPYCGEDAIEEVYEEYVVSELNK